MKIILTESQTSRLIRLLENKSFEDYINDLDEIIDGGETHRKGMNNYSFTKGVAAIQAGLDKLGYSFGKFGIDGKYGNETEKNVKKFQEEEGLEVTGTMNTEDIEKLFHLSLDYGIKDFNVSALNMYCYMPYHMYYKFLFNYINKKCD